MLFILLGLGIVYALRLPRIYSVSPDKFPEAPAEAVFRWRRFELASVYVFLLATWGLAALNLVLSLSGVITEGNEWLLVTAALLVIGLVVSAVYGRLAGRVKRSNNLSFR